MSENLKVNLKTQILEFKRKHNGLVENSQEKLVSGTNIKTVNGNSLLGSGNIKIGLEISSVVAYGELSKGEDTGGYYANVRMLINEETHSRIRNAKLLIFTMANSFVLTPLAQTGSTRCCGSFVRNNVGVTQLARMSITLNADNIDFNFDQDYAQNVVQSEMTSPTAYLFLVE